MGLKLSVLGPGFIRSMTDWINEQKNLLEIAKENEKYFEKADRLTLILAARTACTQAIRTLRGFENWLQNPVIISVMPEEMLREVHTRLWEIMIRLIEFDIKHTGEFVEYIKSANVDIPQLLLKVSKGEESRGPPLSL